MSVFCIKLISGDEIITEIEEEFMNSDGDLLSGIKLELKNAAHVIPMSFEDSYGYVMRPFMGYVDQNKPITISSNSILAFGIPSDKLIEMHNQIMNSIEPVIKDVQGSNNVISFPGFPDFDKKKLN